MPKDDVQQLMNLNLLHLDDSHAVFENINNDEKCIKIYKENNINVYGLKYITLDYEVLKKSVTDDTINVSIDFKDNYEGAIVDSVDLENLYDNRGSNDKIKFNPTLVGSNKISVTFEVPDNADTLDISISGTDNILFSNPSLYNGIPILQRDVTPILTVSRMAKYFYDNDLSTADVTFDIPSADNFINKVRSLNIYNLNRGLFYLIQLTCLELIALSYYYQNDKTKFNLLIPSDFNCIQTNLNVIKNRIVNYDGGKYLLEDIDDLLNALGYMETAFTTSTNNLNLREQ